ncbi:MAG: flagellar export protein FliJ [Synergistaceae bacterium]|nr:flagellar export protein FliJ [Synergistaceae bacterium]MBR1417686.1 flagellar export protein FliJ [Synergistaceae bacterium]MBR1603451.1 flagellar export protein FliJ [Synergistaceae bacterium]
MRERINRFNRILRLREDSRRNEQAILAAERHEETQVLNLLAGLNNEKQSALKEFSNSGGDKVISCNELWFQRQFIDAIDNDIVKGNNSLNDVRQRIVKTEERLVERHKDVRIMETYIDKLKEANFKEELAVEQNELDDVATMQFSRVMRNKF